MAGRMLHALGCIFLTGLLGWADDGPTAPIEVDGGAGKTAAVSAKEWAKLPHKKVEVKGKGVFEGVPLAEVLKLAGVSFEKHPRDRAAAYVLVEGSDGYLAILALAEVEPKVAERVVLLADRHDGKPLPHRLIVPGDKLPVRWVKQVRRVSLHRLP
jgi:DMSO/TMAO reductase YedYZ molybdopterin-dependent catalytic subunit